MKPPILKLLAQSKVQTILILMLLLLTFCINFGYHQRWDSNFTPGDEPAYIESAVNLWNYGAHPGSITWSPGYVAVLSPFVGILGGETGYWVWRFMLFGAISLMVFATFSRIFRSAWIGAVAGFYSQLFLMPYYSPSLQSLVALLYLVCLWLLTDKGRFLGVVFGILLNGIFISGTAGFVFSSFGLLCLIFFPGLLFNKRFLVQSFVGVALFAGILYHFSYDILEYPEVAAQRGRAGLYHQLSIYILKSGRLVPYEQFASDAPIQNKMAEDYWPQELLDRYYVEKFGGTENDLRANRNDPRWPLFLLDWPWLLKQEPTLMAEYQWDVLRTFRDSVLGAFEVQFPLGDFDIRTLPLAKRAIYNVTAFITLIALLFLPCLVKSAEPLSSPAPALPSRLQMLFLLACLSTMVPLLLVKPLAIYFPPFIPVYLMGAALLAVVGVRRMKARSGDGLTQPSV